jgi:DNA transposition AAA+ family ATPase
MGLYTPDVELIRERLLALIDQRTRQGRPLSLRQIGLVIERSPALLSGFLHRKAQGNVQDLAARLQAFLENEAVKDREGLPTVPFVQTRQAQAMLEAIQFAHRFGRMVAAIGHPGFGKTRAIHEAIRQEPRLIMLHASCVWGLSGVLQELCERLGESNRGLLRALLKRIRHRLEGSGRCIIVDDAHTLGFKALDIIRTIYDETGVGVVLVGIMALKRYLVGDSEELEQIASRVSSRIWELPDFNEADLALLLHAVVRTEDVHGAIQLFRRDPRLQSSARRACNLLELAGKLAEKDGGVITLAHLHRALKLAA